MKWFALSGAQAGPQRGLCDSMRELHIVPEMTGPAAYMKPVRWVAYLPLVILPLLAARVTEGPRLVAAVEARVTEALSAAGQGWVKLMVDGRDIEIRGVAPDRAAADAAREAAAGTFGVRRVEMRVGTGN